MDIMDTSKEVSTTKPHTHTKNLLMFLNSVFYGILSSLGKEIDVLFWALSLKAKSSKPKKTQKDSCEFLVKYISLKVNM